MTALANKTLDDLVTEQDEKPRHDPSSKIARVLRMLKTQGQATNTELNRICYRYSARIADLKAEGHEILTVHEKGGLYRYVYKGHRDEEATA